MRDLHELNVVRRSLYDALIHEALREIALKNSILRTTLDTFKIRYGTVDRGKGLQKIEQLSHVTTQLSC